MSAPEPDHAAARAYVEADRLESCIRLIVNDAAGVLRRLPDLPPGLAQIAAARAVLRRMREAATRALRE